MSKWLRIYRLGKDKVFVKPTDSSKLKQKLMADDLVKIEFTHASYIDLGISDFIIVDNQEYCINTMPPVEKLGKTEFKYSCEFEGGIYLLSKVVFQFAGMSDFSFTGNALDFLNLCVANLNRAFGGYTAGTYTDIEAQTLYFEHENVLQVLNRFRDELGVEFSLVGKTLHLQETGANLPYTFKVGIHQGTYDLTRKNVDKSNITTRLWAYGSTRNLPNDYRGGLNRLVFENPALNNESRVEKNVNLYGLCEQAKVFEDIFPTRTGTITAIDGGNNRVFTDADMDFDLNAQLLPELKPKVNFKSGNLIGLTFDCSYDNTTKTFTLDYFTEDTVTYPNDDLRPAVGNTYTLYDIELPQSYVDTAELDLKTVATAELKGVPPVLYSLNVDPMYIRRKQISFTIGDYIIIIDPDFGIEGLLRITAIERNINNPDIYKLEVGELKSGGFLNAINKRLKSTSTSITTITNNTYNKSETNEQININGGVKWQ